jgi:hypothetical protein
LSRFTKEEKRMQTGFTLEAAPTWVFYIAVPVAVAQLSFEIWALIDMLKRPSDRLALGGRKWLWAIIILGVNWIGAILYLAVGRTPGSAVDVAPGTPTAERAASAVDSLYGAGEGRK